MANTFTLIAASTIGSSGSTSVTFSSIPQTYTDLCLKISARCGDGAYSNYTLRFNSATSGYTQRALSGNGSTTSSFSNVFTNYMWFGTLNSAGQTSSVFNNTEVYVPNYASSSQKSMSVQNVTENNATTAYSQLIGGLSSGTSAISQIDVTADGSTFTQYSTFYLYGIKNS